MNHVIAGGTSCLGEHHTEDKPEMNLAYSIKKNTCSLTLENFLDNPS